MQTQVDLAVQQNQIEVSPMSVLREAVQQGANVETLERIFAMQRQMLAYDAEVAFNAALARVQAQVTRIGADATNPQTRSKYATYAALDRALRPLYSKEGFSLSFTTGPQTIPDTIHLVCHLSHKQGHTRLYEIDMPNDGKGAKGGDVMTKTHATGAASSYGMRYLLKMIFNVAIGEDDRDGNVYGSDGMEPDEVDRWVSLIETAPDLEKLKGLYTAAYKDAKLAKDTGAERQFIAAKDKRRAELA